MLSSSRDDFKPCDKHEGLAVDLAVIKQTVIHMDKKLDSVIKNNESKVSWRTFSLVLVIFSSVIGYIFVDISKLIASIDRYKEDISYIRYEIIRFQKGINSCDFSGYKEVEE